MKVFIKSMAIYIAMIASISASEFYSVDYIGNLAAFVAWVFIVGGFICLAVKSEDIFGKLKCHALTRTTQYAMIAMMVSVGWIWTGACYFVVAILMHLKYSIYKDGLNEAAE